MIYNHSMRIISLVLITVCILVSGCATLGIYKKDVFPFRAEFSVQGMFEGMDISAEGAMLINSPERAVAQIYGPGGIAVYTIKLENGKAKITDSWDRDIRVVSMPVKDIAGLIAGVPPSGLRCTGKPSNGEITIKYLWGNVVLDKHRLPVEMNVKTKPGASAIFSRKSKGIDLMITRGSDTLILNIDAIEGGRWSDADSDM